MHQRHRLREARKGLGLSVAKLSRMTGIQPTTLFDLEAGRRYAYPKYRRLLEDALKTPADELFGPQESGQMRSSGTTRRDANTIACHGARSAGDTTPQLPLQTEDVKNAKRR